MRCVLSLLPIKPVEYLGIFVSHPHTVCCRTRIRDASLGRIQARVDTSRYLCTRYAESDLIRAYYTEERYRGT